MKKQVLMCAPFNTRSGYGDHARSIFYSIMDREDFEIKCVDVRWGETPRNHLDPKIPKHKKLLDTFVDGKNIQQPDIYIDIRIPNEFQTPAKFNIGITAGVETDVVSPEFIQGCNKMNLNLGTSKFTVSNFQRCQYDQQQEVNGQQQKVGVLKLDRPMGVLSEGIDTSIYKPIKDAGKSDDPFKKQIYDMIDESFVYLHVGQWGKGKYGEDRKNIAVIISDTFGRAWRKGQVNFAIGSSGINPITSYVGKTDTFENELNATEIAVIDEIASAAELVMEKTINVPIAIVRGVKYEDSKKNASELIREGEEDFFL